MHRQAWDIVQPIFVAEQREAKAQYQALTGAGDERASSDSVAVIPAAYYGRVETLFVALGHHLWGTFDARVDAVQWHEEMRPGDQDLLDFVAVQALLKGGTVYALDPDEMPGGVILGAVFRY
jgi:hypothetical protein